MSLDPLDQSEALGQRLDDGHEHALHGLGGFRRLGGGCTAGSLSDPWPDTEPTQRQMLADASGIRKETQGKLI